MISKLGIVNFKFFKAVELPLSTLSLLTGVNSAGKSTVIQALLLAQTSTVSGGVVPLNGPFGIALGDGFDVFNYTATGKTIDFRLEGPRGIELVQLEVPEQRLGVLKRRHVPDLAASQRDGHIDAYLSAERLGPRDILDIAPVIDDYVPVGERGQFTAHVLAHFDRQRVDARRLYPPTSDLGLGITLPEQTQAWLSWIVRPVIVQANWPPRTGAATLRFKDPNIDAEFVRPTNVGFGLTYALPVVVAGLTCRSGTLLLVENPEAHLHPAAQSRMGQFLARIASAGVQTVVETHSDHVVNGVRLAVASDQVVAPSEVVIHFFDGSEAPKAISILTSGGLSAWPPGFFDQIENDLGALSRNRRRA